MITLFFVGLLIAVMIKLICFAIKAAWGITRVVLTIVLFPAVLVIMAFSGLIVVALPILIITGIVLIIKSAIAA